MVRSLLLLACAAGCLLAPASVVAQKDPTVVPATVPMAISQSGQFTVYGGKPTDRGEFVNLCEALSRDVASVTGHKIAQWVHPFVVQLTVSDSPMVVQRRAAARVFQLDPKGFRFQIDVLLDEDFQMSEFNQEFIKLLLLERMFSADRPEAPSDQLPGWVLAGVSELVAYRRAGRPADIFDALMDARQIPPVAEITSASLESYPDSVSRGIFRACSAALIQALLDQASGPERFQALLEDLAYSKLKLEDLMRTHFPAVDQTPEALAKWWTLQLAAMSERSAFELLSVAETERLLEQYLRIDLSSITDETLAKESVADSAPGGRFLKFPKRSAVKAPVKTAFTTGTIADFATFQGDSRAPIALKECDERLNSLSARCFPLYRPILGSYSKVIARMLAQDTASLKAEFEELARRRLEIITVMGGVTDYMNWYVTTQVKEASNEFTGYAEALKSLEKLDARRRQDPVTLYIDAMERELAP